MRVEFWRRVNSILLEALERSPEERQAFLEEACPDDADLRGEVELLLASETSVPQPLDEPVFALLDAVPSALTTGDRIGPYRVEVELGRGGTGAVYLATKTDGEFKKKVAVKVLKRGMDTDEIVRRFRRERRILANLDHPNIARCFEGGTTSDHRPFLVMEYVDGEPIDRFCDRRGMSVRGRLELFLRVCAAVQFAHQSLVIHRDLKPSNILVTEDGEPKLLDFGIAKLLWSEDTGRPATVTAATLRLMTPAYASPEQVTAQPMTTASDVYSLGVVLYELLTHQRPYRVESPLETDVREVVCHQEPLRPSAAVLRAAKAAGGRRDLRSRRRRLTGDLDNIVLTALHKDPARRYASVDQLSSDIRRHLAGLPVSARKATLPYRTGKFLHRHIRAVALAVAFAVLLAAFVLNRERQQRRIARQLDRAATTSLFLSQLFDVSDAGKPRSELTARDLLDHGAGKIVQEFEGQEDLQAELMTLISDGYEKLGLIADAEPLLTEALRLRRELYGDVHPSVAESLDMLAGLEGSRGRYRQEESLLRQSLAIRRQLFGDRAPEVVLSRHALGVALMDQGRYGAAEVLVRNSLDELVRLEGDPREVAAITGNLAILLHLRGDFDEAQTLYRRAIERSEEALWDEHPQVTANTQNLATCLRDRGELDAAEQIYRDLLDVHDRRLGENHPAWGTLQHNLGLLLLLRGDFEQAEPLLLGALEVARRFADEGHPGLAYFQLTEARLRLAKGDPAGAEVTVRAALDVFERTLSAEHWKIHHAKSVLGAVLTRQGRFEEAEQLLLESYRWLTARLTARARPNREALQWLVELYEAWGRPERAAEFLG